MKTSKEIIALIPARGGSKSIPRKNLIPILGKPLIAWSIIQAQESIKIDRVIVSTDDAEIAEIARDFGAEVPFLRPTNIALDHSTDFETFNHAINFLHQSEGVIPNMLVHLRPTGPARHVEIIDQAVEEMVTSPSHDSLRSISMAHQTPFKMWFVSNDGNNMKPVVNDPDGSIELHSVPRQQLPIAYWQNGYVDIVRSSTLIHKRSMTGDYILPFIIENRTRDLDYPEDIPFIEQELINVLENDMKDIQSSNPTRLPV